MELKIGGSGGFAELDLTPEFLNCYKTFKATNNLNATGFRTRRYPSSTDTGRAFNTIYNVADIFTSSDTAVGFIFSGSNTLVGTLTFYK